MTILDQLAEHARERVAFSKEIVSLDEMRARAENLADQFNIRFPKSRKCFKYNINI